MSRSSPSSDLLEKEIIDNAFGEGVDKLHHSIAWGMLLRESGETKSWSELPPELVIDILQRFKSYQDFVCATSSCGLWRSIGTNNDTTLFCGGFQFPWLMMLSGKRDTNLRGFYNVRKKMTYYLELPEEAKHCVSWHGWLVTVSSSLELNVVHPLSRLQIKLPDFMDTKIPPLRYYVLRKAVFSSSPSSEQDYTLSIIGSGNGIYLWQNGDASWRKLNEAGHNNCDIVFYMGRFYATSLAGKIYAWDTQGTRVDVVARGNPRVQDKGFRLKVYLVESGGSLFMVSLEVNYKDLKDDIQRYGTYRCRVFEVRLGSCDAGLTQVSDLGGRALFVGGFNSSFSINASDFPGCNQNCIYFTDDFSGFFGGGIYHLEDGRFERFPFSHVSSLLWVQFLPSDHILTM